MKRVLKIYIKINAVHTIVLLNLFSFKFTQNYCFYVKVFPFNSHSYLIFIYIIFFCNVRGYDNC